MKTFLIVAVLAMLAVIVGCANSPFARMFSKETPPADRVAAAEQIYTKQAHILASDIRNGVITDKATIRAIRDADTEIQKDLDAAKILAGGDKATFDAAWPAIRDRIDKFIVDYGKKNATTKPKETSWIRSPYRLSPPALYSVSSMPWCRRTAAT